MKNLLLPKSLKLVFLLSLILFAAWSLASRTLAQQTASLAPSKASTDETLDPFFKKVYQDFYQTYRLGPDDEIAVRILGQPDYSLEKTKVSPVGRIYHPLLGDVEVAGLTVAKLTEKLTSDFSQYILNPKVSVSLVEANSAKIGVLGDVTHPGIVVMTRPMTVLEALSASGGVSDFGSKSDVTVLRQNGYDRPQMLKVNVKRIMEGKADTEENLRLQAGDTIIVHGNTRKKFTQITSLLGFGQFLAFVAGR
ncbi:MAG: polysaccharide export protein [Acidobacteria bacterium]|nr:polysaccharide export protein [Acidobacteriota bacterium]